MWKFVSLFSICIAFSTYYLGDYFKENANAIVSKYFSNSNADRDVNKQKTGVKIFQDIKKYNGKNSKKLYLAILGDVYDVSSSPNHYGPGTSYYGFIGKDASRSFVTGKFTHDSEDDVKNLTNGEYLSLKHWVNFYKEKYKFVGILTGPYYNEDGAETQWRKTVLQRIKNAEKEKEKKKLNEEVFPPCNSEWNAEKGSRVWCDSGSGGIKRNWVGFPRKYYEPGSKTFRCACINENNLKHANIKEYEDCDTRSTNCEIKF